MKQTHILNVDLNRQDWQTLKTGDRILLTLQNDYGVSLGFDRTAMGGAARGNGAAPPAAPLPRRGKQVHTPLAERQKAVAELVKSHRWNDAEKLAEQIGVRPQAVRHWVRRLAPKEASKMRFYCPQCKDGKGYVATTWPRHIWSHQRRAAQ